MQEAWKDIKGYEGIYMVSNEGMVKSLDHKGIDNKMVFGKKTSTKYNNRGYEQVHLYYEGINVMKLVHRLVVEAFIENPNQLEQVNHINENKKDNKLENLEWCSNFYNRHYGNGILAMSTNRDYKEIVRNRNKKIIQKDLSNNHIKVWDSIAEANRGTKTNDTSISFCCRGKQKTAGGFKWEYV